MKTLVPAAFSLSYDSGLGAMWVMIAISITRYICATTSPPIAARFIMAGTSPGTSLVFMMAGPATNISTLGVIKSDMAASILVKYPLGISLSAISFGLLLDWGLKFFKLDLSQQMLHSHELRAFLLGLTGTGLLTFLAIKPLRKLLI